ncbi:MAG: hypothetical protein IPK87_10220 [Planctomycetes bacterium]|nr:hypothetical protein [Planctomycetota bacterium]
MKAITVRIDDTGLDALLKRVKVAQEAGFDKFDLCISNPQSSFGRIVVALSAYNVGLAALRLKEQRHDALVFRKPGYSKLAASDATLAQRSAEMVIETATQLAPLRAQFLVLDGGFVAVPGLQEKQAILDEVLDCDEDDDTCKLVRRDHVAIDESLAEQQLVALCRGLHRVRKELPGVTVCLLNPDSPFGLLQPDRMKHVLDDLPEIGYWHSTSSAALLRKQGGPKEADWLERFGKRLKGVYLADMLGGQGEQPPGLGQVKFEDIAPELAKGTVRVMVVDDDKGTKLRFGSEYLAKVGIF